MTKTGVTLGTLAVLADAELRRARPRPRDVALGLGIAAGLYGIFRIGDRLARAAMPRGDEQISEIYALRELRPKAEIAARLAAVVGPAEELFWRGYLQRRFSSAWGRRRGALAAAAAYGGAHLVTRNATLIGAAAVAGLYWSALRALGAPMAALVVSHVVWDIWIFLVSPTEPPIARRPTSTTLQASPRAP